MFNYHVSDIDLTNYNSVDEVSFPRFLPAPGFVFSSTLLSSISYSYGNSCPGFFLNKPNETFYTFLGQDYNLLVDGDDLFFECGYSFPDSSSTSLRSIIKLVLFNSKNKCYKNVTCYNEKKVRNENKKCYTFSPFRCSPYTESCNNIA
jgi:hypothetical protein